jgi:hypothetical protein
LNVPESNVPALALSAALALGVVLTIGETIGIAAVISTGESLGTAMRRGAAALPAFVVGVVIAVALWWLTGLFDGWWQAHRGETDALFIRYLNVTHTRAVHASAAAVSWFVRWVLSLSLITALTTTVAVNRETGLRGGLRNALAIVTLVVAVAVAELFSRAQPLAYWRPARIAPWLEPTFVGVKLGLLYAAGSCVAAAGIAIVCRVSRRRTT